MGTVTRRGNLGEGVSVSQHQSDQLDEALEETFPASDPVAISVDRAPECNPDSRNPKPAGQ
jgi:hypothetical protein